MSEPYFFCKRPEITVGAAVQRCAWPFAFKLCFIDLAYHVDIIVVEISCRYDYTYISTQTVSLCRGTNADGSDVNLIRPASVLGQVLRAFPLSLRSQCVFAVLYISSAVTWISTSVSDISGHAACRSRDDGLDTIIRIVRYGSRAVCASQCRSR